MQLKITAAGDCSHEIKRCLLLGREVMTNLDSIFKSRNITLSAKVHLVKAMVFPVAMYGCESWTIKKAECWRIDDFELWYWRRLLSPLGFKKIQPVHPRGDQSWVFIGRKLKLQYFGHLIFEELTHLKRPWCWERLKAGGEGDDRGWNGWMASPTQWTWVWVNSGSWWWTGRLGMLPSLGRKVSDTTEWLNWTELPSSL